jgi:hypothetical protein
VEYTQASVPSLLQPTVEHSVPGGVMMEPPLVQPAEASVPLLQVINKHSPVKHNYSTRRNREVDYSRLNKGITKGVVEEINLMLDFNCHLTFEQASNKFGNDVVSDSGLKEMKQMLDKDVIIFITPDEARQKCKDGFKFTRTFMFYKDKYGEDGSLEKLKGSTYCGCL